LEPQRRRAKRIRMLFRTFKLSQRLTEQEEALGRVERRLAALEIQWGDTLDRLKGMMGRLLKERARTEKAAEKIAPGSTESDDLETDEALPQGWSPTQIAAQQRILARRNRSQ
jgi:hypothetical protein